MLDPWIIEEIQKKEREKEERQRESERPRQHIYDIDPSQVPNPDETPPADEGYHEPDQKPTRRREEPKKEESDRGVTEVDIGAPEHKPEEEGDEIIPVPMEIITTDDIGEDRSIKINPDHPGNVTHGDVIEGRPRR